MDEEPPSRAWLADYAGLSWRQARDRALAEGRPVRVLRPGAAVTMDFRPDRLDVHLDAQDELVRLTAG